MLISRRDVMTAGLAAGAASLYTPMPANGADAGSAGPIRFSLNTSTIRGQKLTVPQQIELTAAAGYDAIEPWIGDLDKHVAGGGSLTELRSRLDDRGLTVASAIGFAKWIVDDATERAAGLEQMRRDMQTVAALGGTAIAAPPIGAHRDADAIPLDLVAKRYADVLALGREEDVVPQLEVWGFSSNLSKLADVVYVCAAAADETACVLPDIYHLYRGGNDFGSVGMLPGTAVHCFHLNDIGSSIAPSEAQDADRVYPGHGDMPIATVLRTLLASGFDGFVSLELFNREYWKQPADRVAADGLAAMRSVVAKAIAAEGR